MKTDWFNKSNYSRITISELRNEFVFKCLTVLMVKVYFSIDKLNLSVFILEQDCSPLLGFYSRKDWRQFMAINKTLHW